MAACSTCHHPSRREIEKKLSDGISQGLISLWTKEHGPYVSRLAIGRHQRSHMGMTPAQGRPAASGRFLEDVVTTTGSLMASGEIRPSVRDGIAAQAEINRRDERGNDPKLQLIIAKVLYGSGDDPVPALADPDEIEGESVVISEPEDDMAYCERVASLPNIYRDSQMDEKDRERYERLAQRAGGWREDLHVLRAAGQR